MDASKIGRRIGQGTRTVFEYGTDAVIKMACPSQRFAYMQNRIEAERWYTWQNHPSVSRMLTPVLSYAPDGAWLIQPRVEIAEPTERYRADAMTMMLRQYGFVDHDIDTDGIGTYQDRTVVVDYGFDYNRITGEPETEMCGACVPCRAISQTYA